jgi:predicted Rossmann-fold nucleotide-binding protein
MEAPLMGAKEAGGSTAGVKIELKSEHTFFEQDINSALAREDVAVCRYFGPRKVGLVDAAMRETEEDRTAIIVLPGGFGTIDEWSEYVVLKQLQKLGTNHTVPILLMNYEGFFDPLIEFLYRSCIEHGTIREDELSLFHMCRDNFAALEVLAETYNIPTDKRTYSERVQPKIILKAATEHLSQSSET